MSGKFEVYKKSAAAQFSLMLPKENEKGWVIQNGAILVEVAVANGEKSYDWDNKISLALGVNDLCLLFGDISKQLTHDHKGTIKGFQFLPGEGQYEGTYRMQISMKPEGGERRQVMVPLTAGEMYFLGKLFDSATSKILGW